MNDVNHHSYEENRTIYFDDRLDAAMVENLNAMFEDLECLEIINYVHCISIGDEETIEDSITGQPTSNDNYHVTLKELWRANPDRNRMRAFSKNQALIWPDCFVQPGYIWKSKISKSLRSIHFNA